MYLFNSLRFAFEVMSGMLLMYIMSNEVMAMDPYKVKAAVKA